MSIIKTFVQADLCTETFGNPLGAIGLNPEDVSTVVKCDLVECCRIEMKTGYIFGVLGSYDNVVGTINDNSTTS